MAYTVARRYYAKAQAYYRLVRPSTFIDLALLLVLGIVYTGGPITKGAIFLLLTMLASGLFFNNTINDIYDIQVDQSNRRRDRPIATGEIEKNDAVILAYFFALLCLTTGTLLGQGTTLVAIAMLALGVAYSHPHIALAQYGLYGTLTLCLSYFVLPLYSAIVVSGESWDRIFTALVLSIALIGLGRLFLKDYRDIQEKRLVGKNTPSVTVGIRTLRKIALSLGVVGALCLYFVMINDMRFTKEETDASLLLVLATVMLAYWAGRVSDNKVLSVRIMLLSYLANRLAMIALIFFLLY